MTAALRRRRPRPGRGGFTLIEMAVTALVLLIASAYLYPKFRNLSSMNMKSAIRRIGATARYAFGEAVSKNRDMAIEFDLDAGTYRIVARDSQARESFKFGEGDREAERRDEGVERAASNCRGFGTYAESSLSGARELPEGVAFKDVVVEGLPFVVEKGKVCAAFLGKQRGRGAATVVHLIDDYDHEWTLLLNPLTARMRVLEGYREFLVGESEDRPFTRSRES